MNKSGKVLFTALFLQDTAASWFRLYIEDYITTEGMNHSDIFRSYKKFKKTIRNFFKDTDQQAILERKLIILIQKDRASDYTANFQQLVLETGWTDRQTNIVLFLKRLKLEVQYKTVKCDLDNFKKAIKITVQVDNQLYNLQQLKRTSHWKSNSNRKKPWGKKQQNPFKHVPIDINTIKIKKRLDGKKKQKKKYFNCEKEGHFTRKCFKKTEKKIKFNDNGIEVQTIYLEKSQLFEVPETLLQEVNKSQKKRTHKQEFQEEPY
jgi:hypothetical protein